MELSPKRCNGFAKAVETAASWLNLKAGVSLEKSLPTFSMLTRISEELDSNTELESLMRALRGEYITPGPGADIVQNPEVIEQIFKNKVKDRK